jgi:hypothetical protein
MSLPNGVTMEEVEGNSVADILAEVAAHANELPLHITRPYFRNIRLVKRIQLRLAAILTILPNRPSQISSAIKRSYLSIAEEIEIADHTVFPPSTYFPFYHCACCKSYIAQHSSSLRSWIRSSCLPVQDDSARPVPLPIGTKINNKPVHISHRIFSLQGTTYCSKCGAYGSPQRVQKLLKECGPITTAGSNFLAHIKNKGVVPNGPKYSVPTVPNNTNITANRIQTAIQDNAPTTTDPIRLESVHEIFEVDDFTLVPNKETTSKRLDVSSTGTQCPKSPSDTPGTSSSWM